MTFSFSQRLWSLPAFLLLCACVHGQDAGGYLDRIAVEKGIVALVDLPPGGAKQVVDHVADSHVTVYFQSSNQDQVNSLRAAADAAHLLGVRIFVNQRSAASIPLADNLADGLLVAQSAQQQVDEAEVLRAIQPRAVAYIGSRKLVKPVPEGIDDWSHPYHGPDNNPQSNDKLVRGAFTTQFLGYPKFSPMPEQTVVAGGRIFKAMGHIAHKANQNEMLNTLLCINAYNGTVLWKRPNPPGFMIHRNTMIATEDALYMGDDESCKVIDARTGEIRDTITIDAKLTDGPVWKWMAMQDGVLYALVGGTEVKVDTQKSERRGLGHWPWGMWKGHDYKDRSKAFGFGRTLVAVDAKTKQVLWHHRDEEYLDARALCMRGQRIYCYAPDRSLICINARDGSLVWRNSDKELLEAIGVNGRAQHYITGYATTCYMKCNDDYLFFAGPQREKMSVASTKDGKLAWTYPTGNLQLVLRDDAVWAAGPQRSKSGVRLDYKTGEVLAEFPARRACTRATGCADSIFFRASGGTVRVMTESTTAQHIDPMRPPCQDGVIISNGHLYWGPWMCGCQLSLYGNIGLAPVGDSRTDDKPVGPLVVGENPQQVKPLDANGQDWPAYRADNARTDTTSTKIPAKVQLEWTADVCVGELPTAPVVVGSLVFIADRTGAVRAFDLDGKLVWKSHTAGAIYYPPAVAHDRLYVGAADGCVYAFEAQTGRKLWTRQVAPRQRWIQVYDKLISTWPVSGGVVVDGQSVYAAAGIAHYDGTYIAAFDAITGEVKAHNHQSGVLEPTVNNGISVQGNLMIVDGELRFLAGGVYESARYDLKTLECLNTPKHQVSSQYRTAFYPFYPDYGKYVSLEHTCEDGCRLTHDASYEGSMFTNISLTDKLPPGVTLPKKEAARWGRRGGKSPKPLWQDKADRRFTSFVVSGNQLLATGHPDKSPDETFLVVMDIKQGTDVWKHSTPGQVVKGGTAVGRDGRIYVSLTNGKLLCYSP